MASGECRASGICGGTGRVLDGSTAGRSALRRPQSTAEAWGKKEV